MNSHWTAMNRTPMTRRELLRQSGGGFGALALAGLLGEESKAAGIAVDPRNPLAPRPGHFQAKAKRVIFLFMHGGPSQMDTFDPKPLLDRDHGKPLPFAQPRVVSSQTGNLLASPFKFRQHGESGIAISELFPHLAGCVDDLCLIRSMHGSNSRHGGALLELHTGSDTFVRPSMGSWITYGLGTENQDLPGFITVCPNLSHGGVNNWSSAFLPAVYQGTPIGNTGIPSDKAKIPFITNTSTPRKLQRVEIDLIQEMNREHLAISGPDQALEGRIESFELAYRMQAAAPEIQEISGESAETQKLYGLDEEPTSNFGRQCLMARRFTERGVRFVQVSHSYKWDQHGGLKKDISRNALEVDKPIAGLLKDLKSRGLLEDTLVVWGGEFGRTPTSQGDDGRDHNPHGYTMWMAGGGIKSGITHGNTDDYGYYAVEDKVHVHDLHATILHQLGLDHTRLTYRYAGRDFRLTDVYGEVVREILA
ncbi:DUF1501 domain-containing protein [Tundrisphaera lichenicola]|uniref:DUF1501 domain-containing protein n=1 Tax=Tundrisphaera lichenicola TaxID=2029860 RepID=UPI003EBF299A